MRGAATAPDADLSRQREIVDAFLSASRAGDFDALVALLDPDVVLHADLGPTPTAVSPLVRGAAAVAGRALMFARFATSTRHALVNGAAGPVSSQDGRLTAVLASPSCITRSSRSTSSPTPSGWTTSPNDNLVCHDQLAGPTASMLAMVKSRWALRRWHQESSHLP